MLRILVNDQTWSETIRPDPNGYMDTVNLQVNTGSKSDGISAER